jgi:hypothetical protein
MADQHQVNAIMATAICDCLKDDADRRMDPEQAKQIAKCIFVALTEAGLVIGAAASPRQEPVDEKARQH